MLTHDLATVWEEQYRPKGAIHRGMPIDDFFELTPRQMLRAFFREKPDPDAPAPQHDNIAFLRNINVYRASKGLPPETPAWFLKEVPRG